MQTIVCYWMRMHDKRYLKTYLRGNVDRCNFSCSLPTIKSTMF